MTFDYNKLPPEEELERIVADMDSDDCLAMMNEGRKLMIENQEKKDLNPELRRSQSRAAMFVAMRFRTLRENKSTKKKASTKAAPPSLGDLLKNVG